MAAFSPQEIARSMVLSLRQAHSAADTLASAADWVDTEVVKSRIEGICRSMTNAHDHLQTLQGAFDNATIANRVAEHLEPSPADLPAAYTAARAAWITMADDYGNVVIHDMGSPWIWSAVNRTHTPRAYDLDRTANFRANLVALRDALAVFA